MLANAYKKIQKLQSVTKKCLKMPKDITSQNYVTYMAEQYGFLRFIS